MLKKRKPVKLLQSLENISLKAQILGNILLRPVWKRFRVGSKNENFLTPLTDNCGLDLKKVD